MNDRATLRTEIAAAAARLIAEDGCDYADAKRRAARDLLGAGADARGALPDNRDVEAELRRWLHTFAADTQPQALAALRQVALRVMQRLAPHQPHLIGAVLNGTATAHSDIQLQLFTDSAKDVEIDLLNAGLEFEVDAAPERDDGARALEVIHVLLPPAKAPAGGLPARVGVTLHVMAHDGLRVAPRHRSEAPGLHPVEAAGRAGPDALQRLLEATAAVDRPA